MQSRPADTDGGITARNQILQEAHVLT